MPEVKPPTDQVILISRKETPGYYLDLGNLIASFSSNQSIDKSEPLVNGAPLSKVLGPNSKAGDWLKSPLSALKNGRWSARPVAIPGYGNASANPWPEGTENLTVYFVDASAGSDVSLWGDFGIDNQLAVWVNGEYRYGLYSPTHYDASVPDLPVKDVNLGRLNPGLNAIQIFRGDEYGWSGADWKLSVKPTVSVTNIGGNDQCVTPSASDRTVSGQGLPGVAVELFALKLDGTSQLLGKVQPDDKGRFSYQLSLEELFDIFTAADTGSIFARQTPISGAALASKPFRFLFDKAGFSSNAAVDLALAAEGKASADFPWKFGVITPQDQVFSVLETKQLDADFKGFSGGDAVGVILANVNARSVPHFTGQIESNTILLHPSYGGNQPTLRFTAPASKTYFLKGYFQDSNVNGGDGATGSIQKNGVQKVFTQQWVASDSKRYPFDLSVSLEKGDFLDFSLSMNGGYTYDSTAFALTIDAAANVTSSSRLGVEAEDGRIVVNPKDVLQPVSISVDLAPKQLNEGEKLEAKVRVKGMQDGASVFWSLSGKGLTTKDFVSGTLAGPAFLDANGEFSLMLQPARDALTEGLEQVAVSVYRDSTLQEQLGAGLLTTINDTSVNQKPIVTNRARTFTTSQAGKSVSAKGLFSVKDADRDPIVHYNFWDSSKDPKSGYFSYNGKAYQGVELYAVPAAQLSKVRYVPGRAGSSESVWIGASDGKSNSDWAKATWQTRRSATGLPASQAANGLMLKTLDHSVPDRGETLWPDRRLDALVPSSSLTHRLDALAPV